MAELRITYLSLNLHIEQEDMIFVSDIGPLFGHWIPRLAILEMTYNEGGSVDITVSEETAKRLIFKRE